MARPTKDRSKDPEIPVAMGGNRQEFSAERMFEELSAGPPRMVVGAVKPSASNTKTFLISPTMDCNRWVEIPEEKVTKYEHVGQYSCGDHEHPIVRIFLKAPQTPAEHAFLLAEQPKGSAYAAALPPMMRMPAPQGIPYGPGGLSPWQASFWYPSPGPCIYDLNGVARYPDGRTPCP
jgi:hypothetical protein